jgi:D-alanine--poly(phosphoribitol) ligase subunit 1
VQVNVLEYLEKGAARSCPDKIAIVDGARSFTFDQLEDHSKRCATLLTARVDVTHQPIAVYLPKSVDCIFANLGIVYSGNIYANLDIKSPALRIKAILDQVAPVLVITSRALEPQLEAVGVPSEQLFFIDDIYEAGIVTDSAHLWRRLERVIDTDPLCIIHTSGSTGTPKGVVLSHRGTIDFMDWCFDRLPLSGRERIGSLSPFYFDIYTLELHLCLAKGATIVIVPDQLAVFPAKLMAFLAEQEISFVFWVPSIMVNISSQGLLEQFALPALETLFFAGEVFPMKHLNRWRRALPGASFVNLYGPIEITVDCTYFPVDREFADDETLPIGYPCRNTDILILTDDDQLCRAGERGELCVRGSSLAMGYWNNPEKTAAAFVQNPLNSRYPERIYRTGDVVYRNERDEIMFCGRKDFQIKHLGYRIELGEIEYQVLRMAGIANACVLYHKEKKEIVLFYESSREDLTPAVIRRELLSVLPKYMLPTSFHAMKELPRNPNGKIDRNGLSSALVAECLS